MIHHLISNFASHCSSPTFFSLPTWYKYLGMKHHENTGECVVAFSLMKNGQFDGVGLLLIGLGVVDILIRLAALVAVVFVIYGGFRYMTSQGSPEGTGAAQATILNALIGLAVAILAAAIVSFIGNSIGG